MDGLMFAADEEPLVAAEAAVAEAGNVSGV
jgi:hypothetical protein